MRFPLSNGVTSDRLELIERMEERMGEGFVKRAEHYLGDWNGRHEPIPGQLLFDIADENLDVLR